MLGAVLQVATINSKGQQAPLKTKKYTYCATVAQIPNWHNLHKGHELLIVELSH